MKKVVLRKVRFAPQKAAWTFWVLACEGLIVLEYAKSPSHQEVRRRVARVVWVDEKRPDDGKEPTAMRCGPVSWFLKAIFFDGGFSVEILGVFLRGGGALSRVRKRGGSRVDEVTGGFHPAVLGYLRIVEVPDYLINFRETIQDPFPSNPFVWRSWRLAWWWVSNRFWNKNDMMNPQNISTFSAGVLKTILFVTLTSNLMLELWWISTQQE